MNIDEQEQKIINDAIIEENLTVQDIRQITKHSKLNKTKTAKRDRIGQEYDVYSTQIFSDPKTESVNVSVKQEIIQLQKGQLCLRISLYRLDSLIHESDKKLNACSEVNPTIEKVLVTLQTIENIKSIKIIFVHHNIRS